MRNTIVAAAVAMVAVWAGAVRGAEPGGLAFEKQRLEEKFYSEGANVGDFNRDGKADVVSGPFWWEGPAFEKRHSYYEPKAFDPHGYADAFFAFTDDFNGDGWDDVLIVGFPGKEATWFENPKGGEGPWRRYPILAVVDNESPQYVDVVGDERPELVCINGGQFGYAQPVAGDPTKPWVFTGISGKEKQYTVFTHGLGVGDLNGDGRKDIVAADGWWEQPAELKAGEPWKRHAFQFADAGAQMYAYDVNGDGKADVVTSLHAHGYGLAWWEQVEKDGQIAFEKHLIMGSKPEETPAGVSFSQLHAVDLVDMNGDGLKDIVTGKRWWAHGDHGDPEPNAPAVLYWFELKRDGGKATFVPHKIDDDSGVGTMVAAKDVNGDGRPDVVIGNKKGTFVLRQK